MAVFQKGKVSNPLGAKAPQAYTNAVRVACAEAIELNGVRTTKLRAIAQKVVDKAVEGEQWAVLEVGNRIDGKAKEHVSVEYGMSDAMIELLRAVGRGDMVKKPTIELEAIEVKDDD